MRESYPPVLKAMAARKRLNITKPIRKRIKRLPFKLPKKGKGSKAKAKEAAEEKVTYTKE